MNEMTITKRINLFSKKMQGIVSSDFIDWLMDNNFFTAPASTIYHGNYEGGLFEHSLAVTEELVMMTEKLNLNWCRKESPWIVGMFHDLCKIDSYNKVVDKEGVPMFGSDDISGEQSHFEHNDKMLLKGHGDKSIILLSQFMTLTEEEILCIRYHMGAYETKDWNEYGAAIEKYPTVLFTHTADMIASKVRKV